MGQKLPKAACQCGCSRYCLPPLLVLPAVKSHTADPFVSGMTDTPLAQASLNGDDDAATVNGVASIPKGRMAYASDIADSVIFLLSDWASFMTGQCLPVNGGNL